MPITHSYDHRPTTKEPEKPRQKDKPIHSGMKLTKAGYDHHIKLSEAFYYWLDKEPDSVKKIQEELEKLAK